MTITRLKPLFYLTAIPILSLSGGEAWGASDGAAPPEGAASPVQSGPAFTPEQAAAETAKIMARLKALRGQAGEPAPTGVPAPVPAQVPAPQPMVDPSQSADGRRSQPGPGQTRPEIIASSEPAQPSPVAAQKPVPVIEKTAAEPPAAPADDAAAIMTALRAIQSELAEQKKLVAGQQALIANQNEKIQQLELHNQLVRANAPSLDRYPVQSSQYLSEMRGAGIQQEQVQTAANQIGSTPDDRLTLPEEPVGEAPPQANNIEQKVESVPEGQGVLTPRGQFVLDPSIEYTRSSTNRLVFRGIELIPGIQIGAIEASDADRDTVIGTFAMRYGLTNRLEIEGRVPVLYRKDRIQVVQQREEQITREIGLEETGIGDAEIALRYQLNRPKPQSPIWVAGLRVKTDTGSSPYEIPFDEFGVATGLATGSGFWGFQPSLSFLLPSDPVVIYGGTGYLWNIERNINRVVGDVFVGKVDPGDAINANVGFGFALNPRFSFSLGYRHNYIFSTKTQLGDTLQESNDIQVGALNFGMSYRLSEKQSLNLGFQFGVTEDAPDVSIVARIPLRF